MPSVSTAPATPVESGQHHVPCRVPRASPFESLGTAVDAQAVAVVAALEQADPAAPTRCAGWTVAELDRQLGAVTAGLAEQLQQPVGQPPDGGLATWAAARPGAGDRDAEARAEGPGLVAGVAQLRAALTRTDPTAVVAQRTGRYTVADALLFRLIELVAHGRDLPVPVEPDRRALKLVVRALAGLLAERAPGRHVECRVPPHAAVQCVAGPRHTRGTPPNVVECKPVAFVELCTGRLGWAEAVADGRVRTWGDRADLSPWLPLLT